MEVTEVITITEENLIDLLETEHVGPWSYYALWEEAFLHYNPDKEEEYKQDLITKYYDGNHNGIIEKYHKEAGYTLKTGWVNQY